MFKKLFVALLLIGLVLVGCGNEFVKFEEKEIIEEVSGQVIENKESKLERYQNENYVIEEFMITSNNGSEIYGELTEQNGEGIYLDYTYKGYETIKDIKIGEVISVVYNKDDYINDVWDNIVYIEVAD